MKRLSLLVLLLCLSFTPMLAQSAAPLYSITYDQHRSNIFATDETSQRWTITASERDTIIIQAQRIGGQFQPYLRLLDANETVIAESNTPEFTDTARIDFMDGLAADGEYFIEINALNRNTDQTSIPDEYILSVTSAGQRRNPLIPGLTPLPELETGGARFHESGVAIYGYNAVSNSQIVGGGFSLENTLASGTQTVSIPSVLDSGVQSISFTQDGTGVIVANRNLAASTFFSAEDFRLAFDSTQTLYTITIGDQVITTDFYRIRSLRALENGQVLVEMFFTDANGIEHTRIAFLTGETIDLRRANQTGAVNQILLENNGVINTSLSAPEAIVYLEGQFYLLDANDGRLITDFVAINELRAVDGKTRVSVSHPGVNEPLVFELDGSLMGDISLRDGIVTVQKLDGHSYENGAASISRVEIEDNAVIIEQPGNAVPYTLYLPDGTVIESPTELDYDTTALPYDPEYTPRGFNNPGKHDFSTCLCDSSGLADTAVNPANGNFYYHVTDFQIPAHTLPLEFTRHYNSQQRIEADYLLDNSGHMGAGWRHSYTFLLDIRNAPYGDVWFSEADGTQHRFSLSNENSNQFISRTAPGRLLERRSGQTGTWVLYTPAGTTYHFDRAGRLSRISTGQDKSIIITPLPAEYADETDNGTFIVDAYGRRLELYQNTGGFIHTLRDPLLREVRYTYTDGLLTDVQYAGLNQAATYEYNENSLIRAYDDIKSPYTQHGQLNYDEQQRVIQHTEGITQNIRNYVYAYFEERDGGSPALTGYRSTRTITVGDDERVETWFFNPRYLVTEYVPARPEFAYQYSYDNTLDVVNTIRHPTRNNFTYTFDERGNLIRHQDPLSTNPYTLSYEQRGVYSLLTQIQYAGDGQDRFVYSEGAKPQLIAHEQLLIAATSVREREDLITERIYDSHGRIALIIEPGNNSSERIGTQYDYDAYGYVSVIHEGIALNANEGLEAITPERIGRTLRFTHDIFGQLRAIQDANGHLATLTYDNDGRLMMVNAAEENTVFSYAYDERGRVIYANYAGQITRMDYDHLDNIVYYALCDENAAEDVSCDATEYRYDTVGNIISAETADAIVEYTYDALDNLTSQQDSDGVTRFEFVVTDDGYRRQTILPSGKTLTQRYNALGRLIQFIIDDDPSIVDADNNNIARVTYTLAYTPAGYLRSVDRTRPEGRNLLEYTYDRAGRLINVESSIFNTGYSYYPSGNLQTVTSGAGRTTTYEYDTFGNLAAIIAPDGTRSTYTYDGNRNIVMQTDAMMNNTVYSYDALNRVTSIQQADEDRFEFGYDARGNLTLERILHENTVLEQAYTYDAFDRILSATDADGNLYSYEYNTDGQLTQIVQPGDNDILLSYEDGLVSSVTENPGQLQRIFSYNDTDHLTGITQPSGTTTSYNYTFFDQVSRIIRPLGLTDEFEWSRNRLNEYADAAGRRTIYTYDPQSENIRRIMQMRDDTNFEAGNPFNDTAQRLTTRIEYDLDGFITAIQTAPNSEFASNETTTERFTYDSVGRPITYTDADGATWQFGYDAAGNLTEQINPAGRVLRYQYDAAGRITAVIRAAGTDDEAIETFAYNTSNNIVRHVDAMGNTTAYTYDGLQRLIQITENPDEDTSQCTAPERCTFYEYDIGGNVVKLIDADGIETRYFYDRSRLSRVEITAEEINQEYRYSYDDAGNLLSITRDIINGETTSSQSINMTYDPLNRRVRYIDENGSAWSYSYDNAGNLRQFSEPNGSVTTFDYDVYNRVEHITYPDGGDVDLRYSSAGYLRSVTLPEQGEEGNTFRQRYLYQTDKQGRLLAIRHADAPASAPPVIQYVYDGNGNIIQRIDASGAETFYMYDELDRLLNITTPDSSVRYTYNDEAGIVTVDGQNSGQFTYDAQGNLLIAETDKTRLEYDYDASGSLIRRHSMDYGTINMTYDALQHLTEITLTLPEGETYSVNFIYDPYERLWELRRSNGVYTRYAYDASGRIELLQHFDADDTRLIAFSYQYDSVGNPVRVTRITDGQRIIYSYDANHRLIDERWLNNEGEVIHTDVIRYDAAGNRVEQIRNGERSVFFYNERNQLIEERRNVGDNNNPLSQIIPGVAFLGGVPFFFMMRSRKRRFYIIIVSGVLLITVLTLAQVNLNVDRVLYVYDDNGNVITITYEQLTTTIDEDGNSEDIVSASTLTLAYDAEQRLIRVQGTAGDGLPVDLRYSYDSYTGLFDVWERPGDANYSFVYDGETPLALVNESTQTNETYLYASPHERLLTISEDGEVNWHLNDRTGSPRRVVDENGQLIDDSAYNVDYRAFGQPVNISSDDKPMMLFAGQWYDPEISHYFMGLRTYNPQQGRFLQPDPVYQDIPSAPYVYAQNRPTVLFDPTGAIPEPFLEPLAVYQLPQMLDPLNAVPMPHTEPYADTMRTALLQTEAFYRAWENSTLLTYKLNDIQGMLSPLLHDLYLYGVNVPQPALRGMWFKEEATPLNNYSNRTWQTDLTPSPQNNPQPLTILDDIAPLLAEATVKPLQLFQPQELDYLMLLPQIHKPAAVPENWHTEALLEDSLAPVTIGAALPADIDYLTTLTEPVTPLLPDATVTLPEAEIREIRPVDFLHP